MCLLSRALIATDLLVYIPAKIIQKMELELAVRHDNLKGLRLLVDTTVASTDALHTSWAFPAGLSVITHRTE